MKFLAIALLLFASVASAGTGIEFPANGNPVGNVYAFKFVDTASNGLPMWGTADGGVTIAWEIYPNDPGGQYAYWVTFFMDENDGCFGDLGGPCTGVGRHFYYGAHPYPWEDTGGNGTFGGNSPTHAWEISTGVANPGDLLRDTPGGSVTEIDVVAYDQWYSQALVVEKSGTTITMTFYKNLPSTSDNDVTVYEGTQNFSTFSMPATPDLYFADAPWAANIGNHETMNGIFRNLKIWDGTKTESYLTSNANEDTQLLKTGDSELWYHNPNPTPDDISDKSGSTAHDPVWVDETYKPTLYDDGIPVVPEPSTEALGLAALSALALIARVRGRGDR
jgi:hypothetical protein